MDLKSYNDLEKLINDKLTAGENIGIPIIVFGLEKQLIRDTIKMLYNTIKILPELNIIKLEGENISYDEVFNACESLPVMSDIRIVHIQNPQFLKKISTNDNDNDEIKIKSNKNFDELVDYIASYVKFMVNGTILLISYEDEVDIKNKVLNSIKANGYSIEYKPLRGEELSNHVNALFEKNKKKISKADLLYFIATIGNSFELYEKEIDKLCSYVVESDIIIRKHIDECVHRGIENNIFKMVDSISIKNADIAITILDALLFQKEEPLRILGMIIRQYRILYLISLMNIQNYNFEEIRSNLKAKKINLVDFVLNNYIKQAKNYNSEDLRAAMSLCFEADNNIKTSKFAAELVLETLIVKLCK
jgi:DNA polymerase III subunit delta